MLRYTNLAACLVITETQCVYCAVGTGLLLVIGVNLNRERAATGT